MVLWCVQVMEEIRQNKIQVFIPEFDEDDSPGVREMRENIPFAVVGSERMLEVGGKKVRARQYPWGVVEGVWVGGEGQGEGCCVCLFGSIVFCAFGGGREDEMHSSLCMCIVGKCCVLFSSLFVPSTLFFLHLFLSLSVCVYVPYSGEQGPQ